MLPRNISASLRLGTRTKVATASAALLSNAGSGSIFLRPVATRPAVSVATVAASITRAMASSAEAGSPVGVQASDVPSSPHPSDAAGKWNHRAVDVGNDVTIHCVEAGASDAPAVLLVHGWPDCWFGWRHQVDALAGAGFRVLCPDLRGFGWSSAPVDDADDANEIDLYTFENVGSDLVALLDAAGVESAAVVGHDWGGAVVWYLARRWPERVAAVAALCTPYMPPPPQFIPIETMIELLPLFGYQKYFDATHREAAAELDADPARTIAAFHRASFAGTTVKLNIVGQDVAATGGVLGRMAGKEIPVCDRLVSAEDVAYYAAAFGRTGFRPNLNFYRTRRPNWEDERRLPIKIGQPAMMITAENDVVLPPSMAAKMGKFVPNLAIANVKEAGHFVQAEQPEAVNAALLAWLGDTIDLEASTGPNIALNAAAAQASSTKSRL